MQDTDALERAASVARQIAAPRRLLLDGVEGAAVMAENQGVRTCELFKALRAGSESKGRVLLFGVLESITRYTTDWGALVLILFGLYQAMQAAAAIASWFKNLVSKFGTAFSTFAAAEKVLMFDTAGGGDGDAAVAMKTVGGLIIAENPIAGVLMAVLGEMGGGPASDHMTVHDHNSNIDMGLLPVPEENFIHKDEAIRFAHDMAARAVTAGIRSGADPAALQDELGDLLSDEFEDADESELRYAHDLITNVED
jgi:hypothetical protein